MNYTKTRGPTKSSYARAKRAYEIIKMEPGINGMLLAEKLELKRYNSGAIDSVLMSCHAHGFLISEDEHGRLFAFEERGLYMLHCQDRWY